MSVQIKPRLSISHLENMQDMSACVTPCLDTINFMPILY